MFMHLEYTPRFPVLDHSAYINLQHVIVCRCSVCVCVFSKQVCDNLCAWWGGHSFKWLWDRLVVSVCVCVCVCVCVSSVVWCLLIRPIVLLQLGVVLGVGVFHGDASRQDGGHVVSDRLPLGLLLLLLLHLLQLNACRKIRDVKTCF